MKELKEKFSNIFLDIMSEEGDGRKGIEEEMEKEGYIYREGRSRMGGSWEKNK